MYRRSENSPATTKHSPATTKNSPVKFRWPEHSFKFRHGALSEYSPVTLHNSPAATILIENPALQSRLSMSHTETVKLHDY